MQFKIKQYVGTIFKYVYLVVFFALVSAIFHPMIKDDDYSKEILGIIVLFMGTIGGILVYKSNYQEQEKTRTQYFQIGLMMIIVSTAFIFILTGKV